jgi:hypothetical protein
LRTPKAALEEERERERERRWRKRTTVTPSDGVTWKRSARSRCKPEKA